MQPSILKNTPTFPYTVVVHKDRSPLISHQYSVALFLCQARCVSSHSNNQCLNHNRWLASYKTKRLAEDAPPTIDYPEPLRVRSGKPIHRDLFKPLGLFVDISHFTSDFCSFDHDSSTGLTTLVLDESQLPFHIRPGLYSASLTIDSSLDFWNLNPQNPRLLVNCHAECPVSLCLTLNRLVEPQRPKPAKPVLVPGTLTYYIQDFKDTFNL